MVASASSSSLILYTELRDGEVVDNAYVVVWFLLFRYLVQVVLHSVLNCGLVGHQLFCLGFPSDSPQRPRKFAMVKTRFMITSIAVHLSRIAVGDCRDGILFYSYQEVL